MIIMHLDCVGLVTDLTLAQIPSRPRIKGVTIHASQAC